MQFKCRVNKNGAGVLNILDVAYFISSCQIKLQLLQQRLLPHLLSASPPSAPRRLCTHQLRGWREGKITFSHPELWSTPTCTGKSHFHEKCGQHSSQPEIILSQWTKICDNKCKVIQVWHPEPKNLPPCSESNKNSLWKRFSFLSFAVRHAAFWAKGEADPDKGMMSLMEEGKKNAAGE